jgi:uncharacterized protein (TIGR01777 family)
MASESGQIDAQHLEGFDVVIHLAGESIASGRWTDDKKLKIRESRVKGTTLLSESLARLSRPPATFISASAIGYYGNRGDELLTEQSATGKGFLSEVCVAWEKATGAAEAKGIRTVHARFGIILDTDGGALEKMLTPFRMGVGGKLGDGKQWMSWIALDDVVRGLRFLIDNQTARGLQILLRRIRLPMRSLLRRSVVFFPSLQSSRYLHSLLVSHSARWQMHCYFQARELSHPDFRTKDLSLNTQTYCKRFKRY